MLVSADKVSREEVEEINRLLGMDPMQVESFRIRIQDDDACVTVKGPGNLKRFEAEWPVLKADVEKMVVSRQYKSVTKTRHIVPFKDGLYWEIDFFEGDNKGLVMAELEVPSIDYQFDRPDWLGKEVTEENKLGNGSLAKQAWCDLQEDDEELMRWLMGPN
jgi:CYTH domain-containing protein